MKDRVKDDVGMVMASSSVPGGWFRSNRCLQIEISCSSGCSLVYVLCNVYRRSIHQSGLCSASGSGCTLACKPRFLRIYPIVGGVVLAISRA
jgi:hypothetical protein